MFFHLVETKSQHTCPLVLCHSVPAPVLEGLQAHTDQQPHMGNHCCFLCFGDRGGGWVGGAWAPAWSQGSRPPRTRLSPPPGSVVSLGLSRQLDDRAPLLTCPITPDTSASRQSSFSSCSSIHSPEGPCTLIRPWCHHVRLSRCLQRILTEGCARHCPALKFHY